MSDVALTKVKYEEIEAVIGFAVVGGLIVCLRRAANDRSFPGKWCFPGGKIDKGETPKQALLREIKEETGLYESSQINFIGKYKAKSDKRKRIYRISAYQLYYEFPVHLQISDEHDELRLCTPAEVQKLKEEIGLAGNVSEFIIEEYFKQLGMIKEELKKSIQVPKEK